MKLRIIEDPYHDMSERRTNLKEQDVEDFEDTKDIILIKSWLDDNGFDYEYIKSNQSASWFNINGQKRRIPRLDPKKNKVYSYMNNIRSLIESKSRLKEQDVEIEVKHEGILEVPEGKNVDDLPVSHFVNLAKKKGLSKITKALNNLQVWNKKKNPSLSKWAGDMIDKLNKKMEKNESLKEDFEESEIIDLNDYKFMSSPDPDYHVYRKVIKDENGLPRGIWAAVAVDGKTSKEVGEPFRITYDQALGYDPIGGPNLGKMIGKALRMKREFVMKESGMYDYYDTPEDEYSTFMRNDIPSEELDKVYRHNLTVPGDIIEEFAEFVADYFNEDFDDIVNNESNNVWMDDFDSENKYIIIMCSDDEYKEIERWVNKKSSKTKNESYPRYKKYYWKYRLDHPFIDRIENSETAIFTDDNIRNIPLLSCENPDDCYSDNPLYWAVEDADYNGNPLYCTEDKAYKRLKDYLNMKIYERRHDL